jgi:hypothetical protein
MTTKEKAYQLIESFAETIEPIRIDVLVERNWNNAKQCALLTVDELIDHCNYVNKWYWEEVKQQIELL